MRVRARVFARTAAVFRQSIGKWTYKSPRSLWGKRLDFLGPKKSKKFLSGFRSIFTKKHRRLERHASREHRLSQRRDDDPCDDCAFFFFSFSFGEKRKLEEEKERWASSFTTTTTTREVQRVRFVVVVGKRRGKRCAQEGAV